MRYAAIVTLALLGLAACGQSLFAADPPPVRIEVRDKNPWTKLPAQDIPKDFRFAVVSLPSGEANRAELQTTIKHLQDSKPDFVLSVGDVWQGLPAETDAWTAEWSAVGQALAPLETPLFHCSGQHPNGAELDQFWSERFDRRFYTFRLHDILFVVLDTDDLPAEGNPYQIGTAQQKSLIEEIDRHADVRWTFVIMHHPIWTYDAKMHNPAKLGWESISDAMVGRSVTIFAGNQRAFSRTKKDDREQIVVGPRTKDEDKSGGRFDNLVVVKLTADGPEIDEQAK